MRRVDCEVALGRQQVIDPLGRAVQTLGDPVELLDPVPPPERAGIPEPSRSAAPASSCSGLTMRRAYSSPSTTATPTATSATPPTSRSSLVRLPVRSASSTATLIVKTTPREPTGTEIVWER